MLELVCCKNKLAADFFIRLALSWGTGDMQESSLYLSCFSRDATGTSGEVLGGNNDVSGRKARGGDI
nr:hypothetical protein CFP56_33233 [Quercus suber]